MRRWEEWLFIMGSAVIAILLGLWVLPKNPDFRLEEIGLLKIFYVALFNLLTGLFILCLGGFRENALKGIPSDPVAKSLFLVGYMLSIAVVIGK